MRKQEEDRVLVMSSKGYQQIVNSEDGKNLHWCTDLNTELPIKLRTSGVGSEAPKTLPAAFFQIASKNFEKLALLVERGGKIFKWTWKEY